jgi:hypothetical protein
MKLLRLRSRTFRTLVSKYLAALNRLATEEAAFCPMDYTLIQEICAATSLLDLDSLIVPSSRLSSMNLVLLFDLLNPDENLIVEEDSKNN